MIRQIARNIIGRLKRFEISVTRLLKLSYRVAHNRIIIDVTYRCNLRCFECNRSCYRAPGDEDIAVEQVKKFVAESIGRKRKWKVIIMEGGEPTLHPQLEGILKELINYKKSFYPKSLLILKTNGYGPQVGQVLAKIPEEILVENSQKKSPLQPQHFPFNVAPRDLRQFRKANFSRGCCLVTNYGIGLNMYGYYPNIICGGIDRVLGFNLGKKSLPQWGSNLKEQKTNLCPYCSCFIYDDCTLRDPKLIKKGADRVSPSWLKALEKYRQEKPKLSLY